MIVEDEKEILIELSNLLENSGYEVEQIKDFSLAKQEILNSKADLVLLDINIPVINGESNTKNSFPLLIPTSIKLSSIKTNNEIVFCFVLIIFKHLSLQEIAICWLLKRIFNL